MQYRIEVENIKCGGCAGSITSKLNALPGVDDVQIDIDEGAVVVNADEGLKEQLCETLLSMGYPEKGSVEGLKSVKAKASSFVSCAVGRINEKRE